MSTAALYPPDPEDSAGPSPIERALSAGHEALRSRRWEDARVAFEVATTENRPDAWEGLGFACWGLQDAERLFEARGNAYRLYQALGKRRDAARVAAALANDHLDFRGEGAVANGWLKRAERLLEGLDADDERAWLAAWSARLALVSGEDESAVLRRIESAIEQGARAGIADVEGLALALRGMVRIAAGDLRTGMAELDEASVAALSGEMKDPYVIGITCCYLIAACERTRDFDRANQWCVQLRAYCEQQRLAVVLTNCRLQYASVLMARGDWALCESELDAALDDARRARPTLVAALAARTGELRRRQGRLDEAAELFGAAGNHSVALLGGGALDLEQGSPEAAAERLDRYMRRLRPEADLERALGLELAVRLAARRGDGTAARDALAELERIAERYPSPSLAAATTAARGVIAAAEGDMTGAAALEDAADLFAAAGLPFDAAWCRLHLAQTLLAAGSIGAAERAARVAAVGFRELGSARAEDADALAAEAAARSSVRGDGPLTPRETDVLRLVADGLANPEIAERLVLSPHTIHRHLANIRGKLGVQSRSAAVARAMRDGLL